MFDLGLIEIWSQMEVGIRLCGAYRRYTDLHWLGVTVRADAVA